MADPADLLNQTFKAIDLSGYGDFPKSLEAKVRSAALVTKTAAEVEAITAKLKKGGNLPIQYNSPEERDGWVNYLRTGRVERRDMTSAGSGLGSVSGLVPLGFYNRVTHSLKLTDQLFDPDVSTIIRTATGAPTALPTDFDVTAAAVVIAENQQNTPQDTTMGMCALPASSTWRTSIFASLEFLQDSGIPIDVFAATIFAIRYARGFGASLVTTLLAGKMGLRTTAGQLVFHS